MQTKTIIKSLSELPTAPTTIGTMTWNETGDWRYVTPLVADKLAPCSQNCPAGIPIPHYLDAVNRGGVAGYRPRHLKFVVEPLAGPVSGFEALHQLQLHMIGCARLSVVGAVWEDGALVHTPRLHHQFVVRVCLRLELALQLVAHAPKDRYRAVACAGALARR